MRPLRTLAFALVASLTASACGVVGSSGGTYEVVAYFPRAVSLFPSSDVKVLGLGAGSVREIEIDGDRVKVVLAIDDDVPIPADVRAAIVPQSLIGERFVQLMPAWTEGDERAEPGHVIELDETIIPVEPDEALAALKDFLDSLDPDGLGRLITNLADDLDGNGADLGTALDELSGLVGNIADNEDDLLAIIDNFDDFTQTLVEREDQLAFVIDAFAEVSSILADERTSLQEMLAGIADLSGDGLDLVTEHGARLERDIEILTRLTRSVTANLGAVEDLLDSTPALIDGFIGAWNPDARAINLRQNFSPLFTAALDPLFDTIGLDLPSICVPVDIECPAAGVAGQARSTGVAADLGPSSPITTLMDLLASEPAPRPDVTPEGRSFRDLVASFLGGGA